MKAPAYENRRAKFTIAKYRADAISDDPVYLAQREHLDKGLRLARVPEG